LDAARAYESALNALGIDVAAAKAFSAAVAKDKKKTAAAASAAAGADDAEENEAALVFPLARVKRIVQLDDDVGNVSRDAAALITRATELFVQWFGRGCAASAQRAKRKQIRAGEFFEFMARNPSLEFLKRTIPREDGGSASGSAGGSAAAGSSAGSKRKSEAAAALMAENDAALRSAALTGFKKPRPDAAPLFRPVANSAAAPTD
jgi:hypothetical protein